MVRLLARTSPSGKLIVEVAGVAVGLTVTDTYPAAVCPVTARLPVIALAFAGMPMTPATGNVRGVFAWNEPVRPTLAVVLRTRTGAIGT